MVPFGWISLVCPSFIILSQLSYRLRRLLKSLDRIYFGYFDKCYYMLYYMEKDNFDYTDNKACFDTPCECLYLGFVDKDLDYSRK